MIVNVGSKNRVKCEAVREVCRDLFGEVTVNAVSASSGVSHTPVTDDEMIRGAVNRAKKAYQGAPADLGVGLEGGIMPGPYGPILKGWVAVYDGAETHIGSTPGLPLPAYIMEQIGNDRELAHVMEEVCNRRDVRSNEGAFGVLTGNRITRTESFKLALYCAFAPLLNKEIYQKAVPRR
ncbi:MAG: inosine/xanthosine triphosphatase [Candidatus Aureabacteria bacterium]|nr:inosine/xanthosine triphosphatase [Candidatus Auribacterota bacterium]